MKEGTQRVVILGAGGMAREVAFIFDECNRVKRDWEVVGFIDEDPARHGLSLNGRRVLGDFRWFEGVDRTSVKVIAGVGSPRLRKKLVESAAALGLSFCNAVHPNVTKSDSVAIGQGVVIAAGTALTVNIAVGDHVVLNQDVTVGHDATIGTFCNIDPGVHLSGNVTIEEGADLGTGAVVIPGKRIGAWSVIGAGAVVTADIPARVTAVGVPARVIKTHTMAV